MDIGRAKQIVESPKEIEVRYQGVPVWIQHLNEGEGTARVYNRDEPDHEMVVNIKQLVESKELH